MGDAVLRSLMLRTRYDEAEPFVTKDGAEIRELLHPARHGNKAQSLAEATIAPGAVTALHLHHRSEEVYHVTQGEGVVTVGAQEHGVRVGDTVCIPPGTPHRLRNSGAEPLKVLCCCAPAYSHADTQLLE